MNQPIVGIGELLWDIYPDGRKVAGGAPFNFAFHCHQLGRKAIIVSRVGKDDLGRELRERVRELGLSDEFIQTDHEHPTGTVKVTLDEKGVPSYAIAENVAWDYIAWDEKLESLAKLCRAVCFGTLAMREVSSRDTILRIVRPASESSTMLKVFDMNLRQHYYTAEILKRCITVADWVKVNDDELTEVAKTQDLHWENQFVAMISLCMNSGDWPHVLKRGILSHGGRGSTVVELTPDWDATIGGYRYEEEWIEEPGVPAKVIDTVGAGDAFTAAMVCLHLEGRPLRECARFANHYAARVCEHQGATPRIDRDDVERAAGLTSMLMTPDWRPPTLTTPRLVLRPFVESDVGPLFEHARNPNVTRYTLWEYHRSEAETLAFVRDYALLRYREGVPEPYAIVLTSDPAAPIGSCGCFWASEPNKTMELGYWVAEPFWGRGIAVEACRAVIEYAFREIRPERLQARVIAGNEPSRRALEKLRFCYEGTLRAALLHRGNTQDVMMFARLRTEWEGDGS